jgi:hypothetical protein
VRACQQPDRKGGQHSQALLIEIGNVLSNSDSRPTRFVALADARASDTDPDGPNYSLKRVLD